MSNNLSVREVQERFKKIQTMSDPFVQSLLNDPRKGVQTDLQQLKNRIDKRQAAQQAFNKRFTYEKALWNAGYKYVAGIDEVGRGPLAGPVVTCAVILDDSFDLIEVTDSKLLSRHEREQLYLRIVDEAVEVSIAVNSSAVIDELNIYAATQQAMIRSVNNLNHRPSHLIVDAVPLDINIPQTTLIKGDRKSISVAAASIVAKEYRDHLMADYARLYPGYGFEENMGYGTKQHLAGLAKLGATPIHRKTFAPVPKFL